MVHHIQTKRLIHLQQRKNPNPKHRKPKHLYHSSDILSIRFKHTRIIRFFGLFKKYLKIFDTKANFQAFVFL
jgi:hypothetical protein